MTSSPLVVLSPGQGAQVLSMGKAWYEAAPEACAVFDLADRILGDRLGAPLSQLCFAGPADRLNRTDISQPAIYVCSVASWRALLAGWSYGNGETPLACAAGLSLGEYTALHIAGALSFEAGLELVTLRGRAMQDAADAQQGGMLALIGAEEAQARLLCDQARDKEVLVCANFNAPGQIVLSGHKSACERAAALAVSGGIRATPLPVAGAFHSPLMQPAADRLRAALDKTPFQDPRCPVVSNVTALPHAPGKTSLDASIRVRLAEQLTSPVRWAESCRWMAANIKGDWHETAPGKTLAGLMRRIDKQIRIASHDGPDEGPTQG